MMSIGGVSFIVSPFSAFVRHRTPASAGKAGLFRVAIKETQSNSDLNT